MKRPNGKGLAAFARGGKAKMRFKVAPSMQAKVDEHVATLKDAPHEEKLRSLQEKHNFHAKEADRLDPHAMDAEPTDKHRNFNESHFHTETARGYKHALLDPVKGAVKEKHGRLVTGVRGGSYYLSPGGLKIYV